MEKSARKRFYSPARAIHSNAVVFLSSDSVANEYTNKVILAIIVRL